MVEIDMGLEIFSLEGKVAVVTGASRGFGEAIAIGLAEAGADVVLAARTESALQEVAARIEAMGRKALAVPTDMLDKAAIENLADKAMEAFGKIDILVNNAGLGDSMPMLKMPEDEWDKILDVNLKGYFLATQAVGKHMFSAKTGRIINISSAMGESPLPFLTHYAASKGGINALTRCLAQEWATRGITVNAIAPSYFETDMTESSRANEHANALIMSKTPLARYGKVAELIGLVIYLAGDNSSYMTGAVIPLDGGWSAG
jgi:NAD(P)-dependent dehydrogenase (short-subunit alcohol dehydrogenase family)